MANVTINYSKFEQAADHARSLSKQLSSYSADLDRRVRSALGSLSGTDPRGYVASAMDNLRKKTNELNDRSLAFSSFAGDVMDLISKAKDADGRVAASIKSTASSYIGERSWFQSACDWVYNTIFVDWANSNPVARFLANCAKSTVNWLGGAASRAYDWFKHGDGKYWWNIGAAIVGAIAAIAGVITAAAAIVSAGCVAALVLAVVGLVAASIGTIITIGNAFVKVYNNAKALQEDNPGVSRYLGDISGISDAIDKYDMGSKEDNENWEMTGRVIDTTKVVCDVVGIVTSFANLGAVKSDMTGRTVGFKFSKDNIIKNFRSSMGFDFKTENKYTFKGAVGSFGFDTTKSWYVNKDGYGGFKWLMNRHTNTQVVINTVFTGGVVIDNVMSTMEKSDKLYGDIKSGMDFSTPEDAVKSTWTLAKDTADALGKFKMPGTINKLLFKPIKTAKSAVDTVDSFTISAPATSWPSVNTGGGYSPVLVPRHTGHPLPNSLPSIGSILVDFGKPTPLSANHRFPPRSVWESLRTQGMF